MCPLEQAKPRVVLLTHDGAYSRLFMQEILADSNIDVVGVVYSKAFLHRGLSWMVDVCRFMSRVGVFYAIYQAYVAWCLPWLKGLQRVIEYPVFETNDVNSVACVTWLKAREPDFLLSFHFNQKILESVIVVPKNASLNFHPSYLPAWRGVDPVLFALQEPCSVLGGSVHRVTADIDAGDVLMRLPLSPAFVAGLVGTNARLFMLGGRMACKTIIDFETLDRQRIKQCDLPVNTVEDRYDGWSAVGQLGLTGLWKALWAKPRKVS